MRRKRFYDEEIREKGRGRHRRQRGRSRFGRRQFMADERITGGWRHGYGGGVAPGLDFENAPGGFGPPPWAPRWGDNISADIPAEVHEFRGLRPRQNVDDVLDSADRRAWLEARKARLQAWQQHLETRLTETEAELAQLNASANPTPK